MRKSVKTTLIIAVVLAVSGLILSAAGFACGANTSIYFDSNGVHTYSNELIKDENMSLPAFDSIDIDVDMAKVEILPGSSYGIEISYYGEGQKITYVNEDGVLRISGAGDSRKHRLSFNLNLFNIKGSTVKVYVPEQKLKFIRAITGMGEISISGVQTKDLNCTSNLGDVNIKNVISDGSDLKLDMGSLNITDSQLGRAFVDSDMGDFIGKNVVADSLYCDMSMGKVDFGGMLLGTTTVKADMGEVRLTLDSAQADYGFDLRTDMGAVYFNGDKLGGSYASDKGENMVNVDADMGAVRVTLH